MGLRWPSLKGRQKVLIIDKAHRENNIYILIHLTIAFAFVFICSHFKRASSLYQYISLTFALPQVLNGVSTPVLQEFFASFLLSMPSSAAQGVIIENGQHFIKATKVFYIFFFYYFFYLFQQSLNLSSFFFFRECCFIFQELSSFSFLFQLEIHDCLEKKQKKPWQK